MEAPYWFVGRVVLMVLEMILVFLGVVLVVLLGIVAEGKFVFAPRCS